ncbi:hypothetical protein C8R47DRAFT_1268703 [Mycena vitilis]|nr:hypothetical protein C8R47DRAFT_1268703 [Mycena vitilis]
MSNFAIIDDQDTTAVTYTGAWVAGGSAHEHLGTVTSSTTAGNHFSVAFTGSAIGVYGTFDSSSAGVVTTYVIDSGVAATVTSPSSALDSYGQLFWQSDALARGAHKLVVTMKSVNAGADGEGTIWFDYFNVTTGNAGGAVSPSQSQSQSQSSSVTPTSATSSPVHAKGSSTGSSSSASASSTSSGAGTAVVATKSSHAGLIGGIIGALAVLALIAAAVFYRRKRRATSRYANFAPGPNMSSPANGPAPTQPFLQQAPTTAIGGASPAGYGPGGFDSRLVYAAGGAAAMQGHSGQAYLPPQGAAYDPYASMHTAPQSSYAASSAPSSQYASPHRGALSVVGDTNTEYYSDSVADLKRRQQQVVNSYEQGVSGGSSHGTPPLIQHVDSGARALDPAGPAPIELPPTYTPN